ncbi:hypothetical protein PQE70_gp041 [Bacillus phage vB_BanS_Nate]|uniref:Uncharacterized protein n=1 Tax=Bacillus phage vB_BanS_Nate TaxID=2894788 RepID=A0AAE9CE02_9CAUD|nr:hypothetical protein PQE70_gp041 [Bacillus phage vB_BanS_Nate]UGO50894.1 hypothetical protein NATE_41 [Bacillus phage vB_BanS_Nate]
MIQKLKSMSDLKFSFIFGTVLFVISNILSDSSYEMGWATWISANTISLGINILFALVLVKLVKTIKEMTF